MFARRRSYWRARRGRRSEVGAGCSRSGRQADETIVVFKKAQTWSRALPTLKLGYAKTCDGRSSTTIQVQPKENLK